MATTLEQLLQRNEAGLSTHETLATFQENKKAGGSAPRVAIVSCADPRIHPEKFFHLNPTDAIVLRNGGGHPQANWKDIITLDTFSREVFKNGGFEQLVIVHHTDCGTTMFTDEIIHSALQQHFPDVDVNELTGKSYGAISTSLEQSVRDDLDWLKTAPLIRKELAETARGFVFDIKTGKLEEVK